MKFKWFTLAGTVSLLVIFAVAALAANNPIKLINDTQEVGNDVTPQLQTQAMPAIFQNIAGKFEGIDIPIYLPTYLPGSGPYGITNFESTKKGYSFEVIKTEKTNITVPLAESLVVVSASDKPFSANPTEEQLLGKPPKKVQINGLTAKSYENGMAIAWSQNNWEFTAIGHVEQDGIRLAKEMIQAVPDAKELVPGAVQGKMCVSQLGNPIYITASWTYDNQTWYTLDGRSSVDERIKMLQSITRLTEQVGFRTRYYPLDPKKELSITTPKMALQAYFDALFFANNLTLEQMAATEGTLGMEKEPYVTAYSYWSKEWQAQNSYEQFLASWAGTANVELLKLLPAGEEKGQKRFFVETKHLEIVGEKPRSGIFYYTGFFNVQKTADGWRITGGKLEPENLGWKLGGHQPWRADAEQVARISGLGRSIDAPLGETTTIENEDGTVTVRFMNVEAKEVYQVTLVQPEDGIWQILTINKSKL